jgi:pSer/pThr/pTyr-binding forkhead associated (FHA) protein
VSPFVLSVLKYALLALIYFFIYRAVRWVASDLSGRRSPDGGRTDAPAKAPKPAKAPRGKAPSTVVVHDPDAKRPKTFRLSGPLEIGRGEACAIRLDDTYVSMQHARLSPKDGACLVEDLGSTNGTYVNDRRVQAPVEAKAGDVVRVGKTLLELRR